MSMASSVAYLPYQVIVLNINWAVFLVTLAMEIFAFANCVVQRAAAFEAIGTLSKPMWLAALGGCVLFTLLGLANMFGVLAGMLLLLPVTVALVYLLDVRPAVRDAVDGHGNW